MKTQKTMLGYTARAIIARARNVQTMGGRIIREATLHNGRFCRSCVITHEASDHIIVVSGLVAVKILIGKIAMSENIPICIRVKSYAAGHPDEIYRVPVSCSGWQKVRYNGRWFQLFGGIRTDYFIDADFPIPTRGEEA